jgi:hypothetical protein
VGGPSGSGELSTSRGSTQMIGDGCSNTNVKVLVKCVGENLLPTAQAWGLRRLSPPVAAPRAGNRHADLLCYLWPGQALITKLHYQLRGSGMSGRTAATQGDASTLELLADRGPMDAQLGSDLAKGPILAVQVGRTLDIHCVTVRSLSAASGSSGCRGVPVTPATRSRQMVGDLNESTSLARPSARNDPANTTRPFNP